MKKLLVLLIAVGMLGLFSTALLAEVQNVRLGGDIRVRGFYTKNLYDLDSNSDDDDFYIRQRSRISAEADLTDNVWAVATVEADGSWGQEVVEYDAASDTFSKSDNEWDVNIAEAYLQLSEIFYSPWTTKIGRQYLNYGRGFLISSREWENKFDAWRNIFDFYPWTVDIFYSRLVESDQHAFGIGGAPKAADDTDLFGLNLNYQADLWTMEGYVFGVRDEFGEDYADAKQAPIAVGLRFDASPVEAFDFWAEFAYELGKYQDVGMADSENIRAFGANLGAVYVFDVTWEPAIALAFTYASGDDGEDADNPRGKMFDPMFNYNYYGYAFSPYLSNISIINAQLSVIPSEDSTLVFDFFFYTQNEEVSMVMGDPNQDNGGVSALTNGEDKDLGMELDLIFEYAYTEDVALQGLVGWFKPGDAYNMPGNDEDPDDVFEARAEIIVSF